MTDTLIVLTVTVITAKNWAGKADERVKFKGKRFYYHTNCGDDERRKKEVCDATIRIVGRKQSHRKRHQLVSTSRTLVAAGSC